MFQPLISGKRSFVVGLTIAALIGLLLLVLLALQAKVSHASIIDTSGDAQEVASPASVRQDQSESDSIIQAFDEQQNFHLTASLHVDNATLGCEVKRVPGSAVPTAGNLVPGDIAAGRWVNSHLLHTDKVDDSNNNNVEYSGTVTVNRPILGVMVLDTYLAASDYLGNTGITLYPINNNQRGLENNTTGTPNADIDSVTMGCTTGVVAVTLHTANMDQVRIITDADADGDNIPDNVDGCDDTAEDIDGLEDTDGCPEPGTFEYCDGIDNDLDGFTDEGYNNADGDAQADCVDNCPSTSNSGQQNTVHPGTTLGDHCEDPEPDGVVDFFDNCPDTVNAGQQNVVHPGTALGDHCEDPEPDGVVDFTDNCPNTVNSLQQNAIHPGTPLGDHCEDPEPDGVVDFTDNCPDTVNPSQTNIDADALGDACDDEGVQVVNSTGNGGDTNPGNGYCETALGATVCTLQAAIEDANAQAGVQTVSFDIMSCPGGVCTITPTAALALPTVTGPLVIDGTTQPGFTACAAGPRVELDGISSPGGTSGLLITAGGSTVRGLVINRFPAAGVQLSSGGSNVVECNFIGTDRTGTLARPNGQGGVRLWSTGNTVGGTTAGTVNVISGNIGDGSNVQANGNTIQGNLVGTDVTGTLDLGNSQHGIMLDPASGNCIGGAIVSSVCTPVSGGRNVISGNTVDGIQINGPTATGNVVLANYIGTSAGGSSAIANSFMGVRIVGGAHHNTVGAGNVISGNSQWGVYVQGTGTVSNTIAGSFIGLNAAGTAAIGNFTGGITLLSGAHSNTVGGSTAAERNVISGQSVGVNIQNTGATGNSVKGNYIGTNVAGTSGVANATGIRVIGQNNIIGGSSAGERNIISGNSANGIDLQSSGTSGNSVTGNYIGTNAAGMAAVPNSTGVLIHTGATTNTIGGSAAASRNIISGNTGVGVWILGSGAGTGNSVQGNYIGTDATGTADLGNGSDGVNVSSAGGNFIGGTDPGSGNVISGNNGEGIYIEGTAASLNQIRGNYIGLNAAGNAAIGNSFNGVLLAATSNVGGTSPSSRNVISGNGQSGIALSGAGANTSLINGNYIGTDATGAQDLGNSIHGVSVISSANSHIGETIAGAGNVISGNGQSGVSFSGAGSTANFVQGNNIGTNAADSGAIANGGSGVSIATGGGNTIGGTAAGAANRIAYNGGSGVLVSSSSGNVISGNSIHSNTGIGIDLATDGVTLNDTGDGDAGPNNQQNFPVLATFSVNVGVLTVSGSLNSTASTSFKIEYFSSSICDASNHGEGQIFLGSTSPVSTNASGNVGFSKNDLPGPMGEGFITVTATRNQAPFDTSEFSACLNVCSGIAGDFDLDSVCNSSDNCPRWANPTQALPSWPIRPPDDADCDGFPDSVTTGNWARETYIGTDPTKRCASTPAPNDEAGPDAMPPDFNDDQIISGQDRGKFGGPYGADNHTVAQGPFGPPGNQLPGQRFDWNEDGIISGQDVGKFQNYFNKTCA